MTFLANLMFCRLDNFDGPIFGSGGKGGYMGGLMFGMLIRLRICGAHIRGGLIYGGRINGVLRYLSAVCYLVITTGQSIEFI